LGRSEKGKTFKRFEASYPNEMWQMDFKGHFPHLSGRCHPLTIIDDHSRFAVGLEACFDERAKTVRGRLTAAFRRYGLPARILVDNGSPWGSDAEYRHTVLTVWLMRLGIRVSHSRPYHPQTLGKNERFNQTLKKEVILRAVYKGLDECGRRFDAWRTVYNFERPHEALDMAVPAKRYEPSPKSFPETLPALACQPGDNIRKAQEGGWISYKGRPYKLGKAFKGQPVALRAANEDGLINVFFCGQRIATLDLRDEQTSI